MIPAKVRVLLPRKRFLILAALVMCGIVFVWFLSRVSQALGRVSNDRGVVSLSTRSLALTPRDIPTPIEVHAPLWALPEVQAAVTSVQERFATIEAKNVKVLQTIHDSARSKTTIVAVSKPDASDYEEYVNIATAALDAFHGPETSKDRLREEIANLISAFTDYPFPLKILKLAVSADGKQASFSERFVTQESEGRIDEKTSTFTSIPDDRYRDDDWISSNWARRRYGYIFRN